MRRRRYRRAAPGERFLLMPEWVLVHEHWRAASANARAILVDICSRWNGPSRPKFEIVNNNGAIHYGCREAARIGIKKDAAARALTALIDAGFLRPKQDTPAFAADGKHRAREFRVAFLPTHGHVPTWHNPTSNTRRIMLELRILRSTAYTSMPSAAKVVLIEMMRRETGGNNGHIRFGEKDGGHINLTVDVMKRAIPQVKNHGFIVETAPANKHRGIPRKWRLTMFKADGKAATDDFLQWPSKNVIPVSLAHLNSADGLSGAPKLRSVESAAIVADAAADHQNAQDLQALVPDSTEQNRAGEQGEVWVRQTDTYRIPVAGPSASADPAAHPTVPSPSSMMHSPQRPARAARGLRKGSSR
jgi:hypothetical protein